MTPTTKVLCVTHVAQTVEVIDFPRVMPIIELSPIIALCFGIRP